MEMVVSGEVFFEVFSCPGRSSFFVALQEYAPRAAPCATAASCSLQSVGSARTAESVPASARVARPAARRRRPVWS